MLVRFVQFTIPFMVVELDSPDLGLDPKQLHALTWLIVDIDELEDLEK